MSGKIRWVIPEKVIEVTFPSEIDLDYLRTLDTSVNKEFDDSNNDCVHVLIDASALTKDASITEWTSISVPNHPRRGWVVEYETPNRVITYVGKIVARVFRMKFKHTETRADAVAFLHSMDATLPEISD